MGSVTRSVGIIGAGVSGVTTAVHLKSAGLDVTVFERTSVAGGVWVFDERRPLEPRYPSIKPSEADLPVPDGESLEQNKDINAEILHAPPGPCYRTLSNNVPTPLLEMKINTFKPGTPSIVNHRVLKEYIQDTSSKFDIPACTLYNTRVEHIFKKNKRWQVETSTVIAHEAGEVKKTNHWEFDDIVVATGHYHASKVPDIPGLKDWKVAWPTRVQHSKGYRLPEDFKDQNVLLVGASVSSTDIARDISPFAKKIYQVSRGGLFDLPTEMLPENATRIGEIASFDVNINLQIKLENGQSIPSTITLVNGDILRDIDRVLLCTGYHCSFPFLKEYHRDSVSVEDADSTVLVTDGTQMHNLHKDIFYIPDPTLAFVGVPYYTATFTLFEFQAMVLARVFAGKAQLPAEEDMKTEYRYRLMKKGTGKSFHSLRDEEVEYVDDLLAWVNNDGKLLGEPCLEGHTKQWRVAREEWKLIRISKMKGSLGPPDEGNIKPKTVV